MNYFRPSNHFILRLFQKIFYSLLRKGYKHMTVMLIPHSEKKIFNFKISNFSLVFFIFAILFLAVGGSYLFLDRSNVEKKISNLNQDLTHKKSKLNKIKNNVLPLIDKTKKLSNVTQDLLTITNAKSLSQKLAQQTYNQGGPETQFSAFGMPEIGMQKDILQDFHKLNILDQKLKTVHEDLSSLKSFLVGYKNILTKMPSIFPVLGSNLGKGYITSSFGWRRDPFTYEMVQHPGIDIVNFPGTPILATADGIVKSTGVKGSRGIHVVIQHNFGYTTHYFHLSAFYVEEGQRIKKGQVIGRLGNSGRSTGPHLHYEIRVNNIPIDPTPFISLDKFTQS